MNTNVWCDLTNHVVGRLGTGDLDALQRSSYVEHATSCVHCRSVLGSSARQLLSSPPLGDAAVWPHLSPNTIRELASLQEPQREDLLADVEDVALHLQHCESCAMRLDVASDDPQLLAPGVQECVVGRSAPTAVEWDDDTRGEVGWVIDNAAVPFSVWTCRVAATGRSLTAEMTVEPETAFEWQTFAVTFTAPDGFVAAVTFSPEHKQREIAIELEKQRSWSAVAMLSLPWRPWVECIQTTQCVPALRALRSSRQAPFDLRITMEHFLRDRVKGAVALAAQLIEDRAGRPVRCFDDGSILRGDDVRVGTWAVTAEDVNAVLVSVTAGAAHLLWLSIEAEDYGIEAKAPMASPRPIIIAARFAAATTQRVSEDGRRYLDRGRRVFELEGSPKTVIELREQNEQLLIRWVSGRTLRLKGDAVPLDNHFRTLPPLKGDLRTILANTLEWAD